MLINKLENGKATDQDIGLFVIVVVSLAHFNTEQIVLLLMLMFTFYLI